MLKMLQCDEFKCNGRPRGPIVFRKGLNSVIGNESGTNSVGKSTFLMILDFVFGGEDYINKSPEVHANLPPHTFKFEFEFNNTSYYFTRSSDDYKHVYKCDDSYTPLHDGKMTIDQYNDFLANAYHISHAGISWRGAVSRFIRVDRRETMDEKEPLRSSKGEPPNIAIIQILKLYNKYAAVSEQELKSKEAEQKEKAFKMAQKYNYIPSVKNKTEYNNNQNRIYELTITSKELAEKSSKGLLDLDSFQAEELRLISNELSHHKKQRTYLQIKLDDINQSKLESKKAPVQKDYDDLLRYFPGVEVAKLEEVEKFHSDLSRILNREIQENADSIEAAISLVNTEIKNLEKEKLKISDIPNVSQAILDKYTALQRELKQLMEANANFEEKEYLHHATMYEKEQLDSVIVQQMSEIELTLDELMEKMNGSLYQEAMKAPILHVEKANKYTFETPDDGGTGMRYKGLILFDLSVLESSDIPFLVHDSVLLLQIENEVVEKILDFYDHQNNKQVFIAFDKTATPKAKEILKRSEILQLSRNGNELFGRAWNKKDNNM